MLLSSACGERAEAPQPVEAAEPERAPAVAPALPARRAASPAAAAAPACTGTGAHDQYAAAGISCAACHPCGAPAVLTCSSCHGDATRAATALNPQLPAAPPIGTRGETATTTRAVGAHQRHLVAGSLSNGIACTECHVVPASVNHPNGVVGLTWGPLATAGGVSPSWTAPVAAACGTCHGLPPGGTHPAESNCGTCHPGYTATAPDLAQHMNGVVDVTLTCSSCHGDATRAATALNPQLPAAPPVGTLGETATTTRAVGAHLKHLQGGTLSNGIACAECHAVPTSMAHPNGTVALTWGPLARTGASAPAWNRTGNTCSGTWCHGAKLTGGTDTTPIWTTVNGTQDACGTCHGLPPRSGSHGESEHRRPCGYCHGGSYTGSVADKPRHFNGKLDVDGPYIRSWNPATRSCSPSCHERETWGGD